MKTKFITFFAIILLFNLQSCKKENSSPVNSFSYSGNECTISKAFLFSVGKHSVYTQDYAFNLILVSPTIKVSVDSSDSFVLSGKGNYLNIGLLYADSTALELGKYYSYPKNNRKILGLDGGVDFDTDKSIGLKIILEEDNYGELTINKENGNFVFNFEMLSAAEKTLKGNFKGIVENLN